MRRFLSLIFLLLSIHGFAQYKTVYSDATTFFKIQDELPWDWERPTSIFIPVKIETTRVVNEDTLYDNYRVFEDLDGCIPTNGYAWTGKKIIMTKDHREIFINRDGDSIIFKKYADINDSWIFFKGEQNHFVATVTNKRVEAFTIYEDLVTDSVLTISISLKRNKDNIPLTHSFNGKEWKISKKYGFVKTYDLLWFPHDTTGYILSGIDKNDIGVKNLTEKDFFDFEVGDELHIREFEYQEDEKKIVQKVLEKYITAAEDTVIYKISIVENVLPFRKGVIVKFDTLFLKVPLYPELTGVNAISNKVNKREYAEGRFDLLSNYQFLNVSPPVMAKSIYEYDYYLLSHEDSCYIRPLSGYLYYKKPLEYMQGLGGPYYIQTTLQWLGEYGKELVYYKKSYGEWGTPMDIVLSTYPNKISATVSLSPNPATDRLFISSEGIQNTSYKVFNAEGREVLNGNFIGTEENVDVNSLKAGIYSLMILNEGGVIYTSRFVKN
jgi:hypothetical protein